MNNSYPLFIEGETEKKNVKFQWISINHNLSFEYHISTLCKKASNRLNGMGRIQKYKGLF